MGLSVDTVAALDLEAIKERAEKATPGPWKWDAKNRGDATLRGQHRSAIFHPHTSMAKGALNNEDDGEFIAASRSDIPALVQEVERLTEERDAWKRSAEARQLEYLNAISPQPEGAQS